MSLKQPNLLTIQSKWSDFFKSKSSILGCIKILKMHFLDFICVKMHDFCITAIPVNNLQIFRCIKLLLLWLLQHLEQEGVQHMLEFWLTADNVQCHLKSQLDSNQYNAQNALDDAMIIYDKWVQKFCSRIYIIIYPARILSFDLPRKIGKRKETLLMASMFFDLPLVQGNGWVWSNRFFTVAHDHS